MADEEEAVTMAISCNHGEPDTIPGQAIVATALVQLSDIRKISECHGPLLFC